MADVILDKSYLHGVSTDRFREIHKQHTLLMTDPLFRELVTTRHNSMTTCFQAIPPGEDPVVLIPEIGVLLEYERKEHTSCLPLSARRLSLHYTFHSGLREGKFSFDSKQKEAVEEIGRHHRETAKIFFRHSAEIPRIFPELNGCSPGQPRDIVYGTMHRVAREPDRVREIYSHTKRDNDPNASLIDEHWLLFRLVQAHLLGSIECFSRYGMQDFECPPTKVEHLRQDVDYVALASLTGGLASRDLTLNKWFRVLRPDGLLIT